MKNKKQLVVSNGVLDLKDFINGYFMELTRCVLTLDRQKIELAIDMIVEAYKNDRKVFILGNGGSATTASHMACDLGKGTLLRVYDNEERRLKVISLTDNIATLTAFGNDLSFEDIFIQQLRNLIESDDVVIALSGSGNSANVLKAIKYAKSCGAKTIGVLGFKTGGKAGSLVDCPIIVDSNFYGPIEDIQLVLNHLVTAWIAKVKNIYDGKEKFESGNSAVPFK